ncbi:hypothetical protein IFM89_001756 [Coptis chinensis]|uniref:MADS-box domain-containing protein n=1 Tax=Coptis chinensis TaxID=261450 RepID=A0A835HFT8_9MAGN|nr:hypothetical protein IFM89_001756 [Coptis chinensis]
MEKRPCRGRQKIEIKRIENEAARQVTFSKRRAGVFKKASEISILCGVDTLIVVFSPAGKPFSFGHPNIDSVLDRALSNPESFSSNHEDTALSKLVDAHRVARILQLNREYEEISDLLDAEKKRGEELKKSLKESNKRLKLDSIDKLSLRELVGLKASMEELKNDIYQRAFELKNVSSPAPMLNLNYPVRMVDPYNSYNFYNAATARLEYDFRFERKLF